ncbi:MAG: NAD-dependent epimerase/dehydratase family protein [Planctomycetota bacterium]
MALYVVTGGGGFIGSHLTRQLLDRGDKVRVLDIRACEDPDFVVCIQKGQLDWVLGDIRDISTVREFVQGADAVFHLAANPRLWTRRRGDFHSVNMVGSRVVLEEACLAGCRRVVHCSTESILTRQVQDDPIRPDQVVPKRDVVGPYCRSKYQAEVLALSMGRSGHPVIVVNPTLPIGPGDSSLTPPTRLIRDFCLGKRREYIHAELNLIDVRDVARGLVLAMERGVPGRRYLLGSENMTVYDLFKRLSEITKLPGPRYRIPYHIALLAALCSELAADLVTGTEPEPSITGVLLARRRMVFDARESLAELGLIPESVDAALINSIDWLRSNGHLR